MFHTPYHKVPADQPQAGQIHNDPRPASVPSMLDDYLTLDGVNDATEDEFYAALQRQIDNGSIWDMQGRLGRMAAAAIDAGVCTAHREAA